MGQSASSERSHQPNSRRHELRQFSRRLRHGRSNIQDNGQPSESSNVSTPSTQLQASQGPERARPFATFSRQISAQSIPARDRLGHGGDTPTQDRIFYQQQEERPLVHMEELGMRNGPITHITASPMPRRQSTLARLTSRIVPQHGINGPSGAEEEHRVEFRPPRRRLSERLPSRVGEDSTSSISRRFSMLGPLTRASSLTSRPRRRRELAPISGPFPLVIDGSTPASTFMSATAQDRGPTDTQPASQQASQVRLRHPSVRNSRMSRVRHSLSLPFEGIRPISRHILSGDHRARTPPERPSRSFDPEDPDYFLPPLAVADTRLDMENSVLQSQIPEDGEQVMQGPSSVAQASPNRTSGSGRWPDRGSDVDRESRRMPNMLRGRSSRLIRRQDEGPLPRILHLAAVAIAAQLSGNPEQAITNLQAVGADGFDDGLNNLFQTLHEATDTVNSAPASNGPSDSTTSLRSLPPLNFLRVFRFVNSNQDPDTQSNSPRREGQVPRENSENPPPLAEDAANRPDGRTVTLVVVGVRSVPSDHIGHEEVATTGPGLEALLNMPLPPAAPPNFFRGSGSGSFLRRSDGRSRLPRPRRASIGGVNPFPASHSRQRQHHFNSSPNGSGLSTPGTGSGSVSGFSDLPSGSHPPPTTPAEPGLSPYASGTTTPNRRPSSASALHQPSVNTQDMAYSPMNDPRSSSSDHHTTQPVHQRRRSDSEFARHRNLGAGAARRNGVVAPDGVETENNMVSGSRSWLIYVVGTNISENHPALTTPSLFTDNPTYEDMLLLSSLLGPARPPVASREDVASAPGVYQIQKSGGTIIAAALRGFEHISIASGERCLVCLCDGSRPAVTHVHSVEVRGLTRLTPIKTNTQKLLQLQYDLRTIMEVSTGYFLIFEVHI
ncbi:MAG: hypothetical protein Q9170_004581 [Blastenia crenularia]